MAKNRFKKINLIIPVITVNINKWSQYLKKKTG